MNSLPYTQETMNFVIMKKYLDDMSNLPTGGRELNLYPMNFKPNNDKRYTYTVLGMLFGYKIIAPNGTSNRPPKTDLDCFKDKLRSLLDE